MAKKSTALTKWDEALAAEAKIAAGMEANTGGGGKFFSIKGGILSFGGNPLPKNQMAVIVADSIMANAFYEGQYDPENPLTPTCYAFGRSEKDMVPHDECASKESESCSGCPMNEWGTANVGKGKACKNQRRLALLAAGTFDKEGRFEPFPEGDHLKTTDLAYLQVPPTSLKAWATYVKQLAATMNRPPHGVVTRVSVQMEGTYPVVSFDLLEKVGDKDMGVVMERHKEAEGAIEFPFPKMEDKPKAPARRPGQAPPPRRPPQAPARPAQKPQKRGKY